MKDLARLTRDPAGLRSRLIVAEVLARPGRGPLARRFGVARFRGPVSQRGRDATPTQVTNAPSPVSAGSGPESSDAD